MLNWKAEIARANARVQEQVEQHLASKNQPTVTVAKARNSKPKQPKRNFGSFDVTLAETRPAKVVVVTGYFVTPVGSDTIHQLEKKVEPPKQRKQRSHTPSGFTTSNNPKCAYKGLTVRYFGW